MNTTGSDLSGRQRSLLERAASIMSVQGHRRRTVAFLLEFPMPSATTALRLQCSGSLELVHRRSFCRAFACIPLRGPDGITSKCDGR